MVNGETLKVCIYRDYLFYWKMFENDARFHRKKGVRSPYAQTAPKSADVSLNKLASVRRPQDQIQCMLKRGDPFRLWSFIRCLRSQ